ncbi:MAG: ribonuclease PH [bacterium]|nr:ribonuclease PH [bacterium]
MNKRFNGRDNLELRKIEFFPNYLINPYSSVLGKAGNTIVLVSVNLLNNLPDFCRNYNHGWITAEYRMLPSSTIGRNNNIINSRALEIKRFIGRSLRSAVDLYKMSDLSLIVDVDVLQADGGTRILAVNTAFLALNIAFNKLISEGIIKENPIKELIAAMSFVVFNNEIFIDPDYLEDSSADCDINIVVNHKNQINELQFTAEKNSISKEILNQIIDFSFIKAQDIFNIFKNYFQKLNININFLNRI